jgi:autotransporter-associated beta strand protein
MPGKLAGACFVLGLAVARIVVGDTIGLSPCKDNTLIQTTDAAKQLSNGTGAIYVGRTNQDYQDTPTISIRRGLMEFNLVGDIPAGATITAVSLTLSDVRGQNGDEPTALRDMLRDWGEGTSFFNGGQGAAATNNDATWLYTFYNAANPSASPTWTTPGGAAGIDFSSTVSAVAIDYALGAFKPFVISSTGNPLMVADLQNWLDHPAANFGWIVLGNESQGQTAKRFGSREGISPESPPLLAVSYTVAAPTEWNDVSGNWTIPADWSTGTVPKVSGAEARFLGKATQDRTATVDAPITLGAILFDNAAHRYTLTGTSDNPITMNDLSGTAAITVNNGTHEISAPIVLATNTAVTVTNVADALTLSGDISGTGTGLTKQGSGTLLLSGENSYDGGTSVLAGTLDFGNALALPPGSNATVGTGGVIVFSSGYTGPITSGGEVQNAGAVAVPEPAAFALLAAAALTAVMVGRCARRRTGKSRIVRGGAPRLSRHLSARYNCCALLGVGSGPTRVVYGNPLRKDG